MDIVHAAPCASIAMQKMLSFLDYSPSTAPCLCHLACLSLWVGFEPVGAMWPMGNCPPRAPLLPQMQQEDKTQVLHCSNASGELPVIQNLMSILPDNDNIQRVTLPQPPLQPSMDDHQTPPPDAIGAHDYPMENRGTAGESSDSIPPYRK